MRTIVYVDGFNLYYGCLRGTPYRWLDLSRLASLLLAESDAIVRIKYYTARVRARPHNTGKPARQQLYLRALRTLSLVEIHFGHYVSREVVMPIAGPSPVGPRYARVIRSEEKGSDVNLATHLVADAYEGAFEMAVIVTNDSDLLEPVRVVHGRLGKPVGIVNPQRHPARALAKAASFYKQIRPAVLGASQFPHELRDDVGWFRKPAAW
jgi:uncharacterized LabA/DUF88 family protein